MDWGSLAGELASLGASNSTLNVALEAGRWSEQRYAAAPIPNPALAQQQALRAFLAQHQRPVDVARVDLSGLWVTNLASWLEVVAGPSGFTYVGRDLLNRLVSRGLCSRAAVRSCAVA